MDRELEGPLPVAQAWQRVLGMWKIPLTEAKSLWKQTQAPVGLEGLQDWAELITALPPSPISPFGP